MKLQKPGAFTLALWADLPTGHFLNKLHRAPIISISYSVHHLLPHGSRTPCLPPHSSKNISVRDIAEGVRAALGVFGLPTTQDGNSICPPGFLRSRLFKSLPNGTLGPEFLEEELDAAIYDEDVDGAADALNNGQLVWLKIWVEGIPNDNFITVSQNLHFRQRTGWKGTAGERLNKFAGNVHLAFQLKHCRDSCNVTQSTFHVDVPHIIDRYLGHDIMFKLQEAANGCNEAWTDFCNLHSLTLNEGGRIYLDIQNVVRFAHEFNEQAKQQEKWMDMVENACLMTALAHRSWDSMRWAAKNGRVCYFSDIDSKYMSTPDVLFDCHVRFEDKSEQPRNVFELEHSYFLLDIRFALCLLYNFGTASYRDWLWKHLSSGSIQVNQQAKADVQSQKRWHGDATPVIEHNSLLLTNHDSDGIGESDGEDGEDDDEEPDFTGGWSQMMLEFAHQQLQIIIQSFRIQEDWYKRLSKSF